MLIGVYLIEDEINRLITNKISLENLKEFSFIIGANPSKGARSPILWNKVYSYQDKQIRMLPFDVEEANLEKLIMVLQNELNCLGGAVAVPYKEKVFAILSNNCNETIRQIGAINCIFRSNPDDQFFSCTNTDGEGALEPITKILDGAKPLKIGLIGYGGAGKAIAGFLQQYKDRHEITVFNRTLLNKKFSDELEINFFDLKELPSKIGEIDILINATSVGSQNNLNEKLIRREDLHKLKNSSLVYDIIYDPPETMLLKDSKEIGLDTINGMEMNLLQAVLAYKHTNNTTLSLEELKEIMGSSD